MPRPTPTPTPTPAAPARRPLALVLLLGALLGLGLVLDVGTAPPASAHATVVATTPADGDRLATAPAQVTVTFDEAVSLGAGYARVLDGDGRRVDTGAPAVRDGVLTVPVRAGLPDSGYVVTYRVVSADSHPVAGAFAFVVGDAAPVTPAAVAAGGSADPGVAVLLPLARAIGYAGTVAAVGVPLLLATCWPGGWARPGLRRAGLAGAGAVVLGALLSLLAQGPNAAGAGLGSLLDPQLVGTTAGSGYGRTLLLRAALAVLLGGVLLRGWRPDRPPARPALVAGGALAAGLVVAVAAVGHPVAGPLPGLAVAVSTVHVAAMSGWLGGLVVLVGGALRGPAGIPDLPGVLARWSRLAAGYVAALVVTGGLQSVREVGSLGALLDTGYGRVLSVKLVVVLVVLAAAAVSRDWVQQQVTGTPRSRRRVVAQAFTAEELPSAGGSVPVRVLRRAVLVELAGAVVVLALSAVLVSQPPARASAAAPVETTIPLRTTAGTAGSVQVFLSPASPGPATLHVDVLDDGGDPVQPRDVTVALAETAQQIGPLDVPVEAAGTGHYAGEPVLPAAGTWTLTVTVRLDEFTAGTASTTFPVR